MADINSSESLIDRYLSIGTTDDANDGVQLHLAAKQRLLAAAWKRIEDEITDQSNANGSAQARFVIDKHMANPKSEHGLDVKATMSVEDAKQVMMDFGRKMGIIDDDSK